MIARPNCVLQFLVGKENMFLHKKISIYKVYVINEQDTSFYCEHKHMMKSGVQPDKIGVLCTVCYL